MITRDRLIELLLYDPITGKFVWRYSDGGHIKQYETAGSMSQQGYWTIRLDGQEYQAGRLAWLYFYGEWPKSFIDHQDLNRSNNQINNLRDATNGENRHNSRAPKSNRHGIKGITPLKSGRWVAQIQRDKKQYYLGSFATAAEAHEAYCKAAKEFFGKFARTE